MRRALGARDAPAATGTPPRKLVKWLSAFALTGFSFFLVSISALHVLRTDCDPMAETVSQYAIGPYGYLMTIAFFGLGPAVLALALGLWQNVTPRPRSGSLLLVAAGVCVLLVGVFPVDRAPDAMPTTEAVHDAAFMASFVFTVTAMIVLIGHFKQDARWRSYQPVALTLSVIAVAGLVAFVGLSDTSWRGAAQRVCILTILSWLMLGTARLMFVGSSNKPLRCLEEHSSDD